MPLGNPLGYLKKAIDFATEPMVDDETIDSIDAPALDRSPFEAKMRGFGAGVADGLQEFTSPLGIASLMGGGGALGHAAKAARGVSAAAKAAPNMGRSIQVLRDTPVKQVMPRGYEVNGLIDDLQRTLAKIPGGRR